MIDPETPEQWQEAVDVAHALLGVDAARKYGLVSGGPTVIVSRCDEILERGKELGYTPNPDTLEAVVDELVRNDGA